MSDPPATELASTSRRTRWLIPAALALLVGCTPSDSEPQPVSPSPFPGAELVCGIDPADVERATGYLPDRWTNNLSATSGKGSGTCEALSDHTEGELLVVDMRSLDDAEALAVRQRMAGEVGNLPRLVYDPDVVDGAVWGADDVPGPRRSVAANSEIFWGDTHISVYIAPVAAERSGADDLLNITYQVIDTYDLERPGP